MSNKYKRPVSDEELEFDIDAPSRDGVEDTDDQPAPTPEEETYRKRYGDLRRHSQEQMNALNTRIQELERQVVNKVQDELPRTEAELENFAKKYPDVAAMIRTMAAKEVSRLKEEVDGVRNEITQERSKSAKQAAQHELNRQHPEFFAEYLNMQDFHDWLNSKSKAIQDTLLVNETDVSAASDTIQMYKDDRARRGLPLSEKDDKPKRGRPPRGAEADVPNRGSATPGNGQKKTWRESEIENLSGADYERFEDDIESARREGRIEYDISGAAR